MGTDLSIFNVLSLIHGIKCFPWSIIFAFSSSRNNLQLYPNTNRSCGSSSVVFFRKMPESIQRWPFDAIFACAFASISFFRLELTGMPWIIEINMSGEWRESGVWPRNSKENISGDSEKVNILDHISGIFFCYDWGKWKMHNLNSSDKNWKILHQYRAVWISFFGIKHNI